VPEQARERHPEIEIVRNGSSRDAIGASDVAVVLQSTTALEACAMGVPLVCIETGGDSSNLGRELASYGACLLAGDATEMERALRSIEQEPQVRSRLREGSARAVEDLLGGTHASAERAAAAIAEAVQSVP
jgi:glycosyltransferase involved in cell wall biosynthesis